MFINKGLFDLIQEKKHETKKTHHGDFKTHCDKNVSKKKKKTL